MGFLEYNGGLLVVPPYRTVYIVVDCNIVLMNRRKTIVRSVRITQEVDDRLQKDALATRANVGTLISTILTKYTEWDRYAQKFGYVSIPAQLFASLLDSVDDGKIVEIAGNSGVDLVKEMVQFWFRRVDRETFFEFMQLLTKYGGVAEYDFESNGKNHVATIHHHFGQKWSDFFATMIKVILKESFGMTLDRLEASKSQLVVEFNTR